MYFLSLIKSFEYRRFKMHVAGLTKGTQSNYVYAELCEVVPVGIQCQILRGKWVLKIFLISMMLKDHVYIYI